jgi:hypothetical protein
MENKAYDYKSTDYDDYKAYLKYSTNGKTLVFSDKDSIARLKRKYTRIWLLDLRYFSFTINFNIIY